MHHAARTGLALAALALFGAATPAHAQALMDVIDIEGTIIGPRSLSLTYGGTNESASGQGVWDETGLVSGDGGQQVQIGQGSLSVNRSHSPVASIKQSGSTVSATLQQAYIAYMSHSSFGSTPTSVTYDASWTLTGAATVTITGFVLADIHLSSTGNFQYTNAIAISVTELVADEGTDFGTLTGPRGLSLSADANDLVLVPGVYHLAIDADGSVLLRGTLVRSGIEVARYGAGGTAVIRLQSFAAIPPEYDLDGDGDFTIDDLEAWRIGSSSGLPVYDTLGDGSVGDEDRAELFRALGFVDPGAIEDCDANGRHDPFEVTYDGAGPPCYNPCFADCDGSGTLNIDDVDCFVAGFLAGDTAVSDCDGNGVCNIDDIDCFVDSFLAGCP